MTQRNFELKNFKKIYFAKNANVNKYKKFSCNQRPSSNSDGSKCK